MAKEKIDTIWTPEENKEIGRVADPLNLLDGPSESRTRVTDVRAW